MFSPLHHKTLVILRPKTNILGLLSGKYMPRKIVSLRFCDTRQTLSIWGVRRPGREEAAEANLLLYSGCCLFWFEFWPLIDHKSSVEIGADWSQE